MPERTHTRHLAERPLWDAAGEHGAYRMPVRGRTLEQEGFIHCSTRARRPSAAALPYGFPEGLDDRVVLVVDPVRLDAPVTYEAPEPGAEKFPQGYGPIPVDAVAGAEPWR